MNGAKKILNELLQFSKEREWFEFKENWFQPVTLGEYVSALSNAAALFGKDYGYFVWGINDETHEIVGTNFDQYQDYKHEPYQNYLNRNLNPKIKFDFIEDSIEGRRVVVLVIEAARDIPTSFDKTRFIGVGSSKDTMENNPKKEKELFKVLKNGYPTIVNTPSKYQDLTFEKLFMYYGSKGVGIKQETFKKNLHLLTKDGEYSIMAQILSDNSQLPLRVSIFEGETKGSNLYSIKEFGFDCLLYSLKKLIDYGDVINIVQSDETNRKEKRHETFLFDIKSFNEDIVNAILHNKWVDGNEPMITIFSNRIEILSRGTIAPAQTIEGFYLGESVPVNEKLSDIFVQLRISDKSGRGVPKIIEYYSKKAFEFRDNSIVVTIPFNANRKIGNKVGNNGEVTRKRGLNSTREKILSEMRHNPNITKAELIIIIGISDTAIDNNIRYLRTNGKKERGRLYRS
ncbi:MAG: putative DNA binding domain-containing protein [Bacilli bacterium]|nr:putative DNA binding domain-containing protein [Bacilli bacterium]